MIFRKTSDLDGPAKYVAEVIGQKLEKGQHVLWLLSGGSAINLAVQAAKLLNGRKLGKLTVTLADERYGPVGHKDSNWAQLESAGFKLPGAQLEPVLKGEDIDRTTADFGTFLAGQIKNSDYLIGLIGIGYDGHAFGILPHSPAVAAGQLVINYQGPDYVRITPTPSFIKHLDEAVVYAMGESKHKPLDDLEKELPIGIQPAQALKQVKELIIYNDYKGETS